MLRSHLRTALNPPPNSKRICGEQQFESGIEPKCAIKPDRIGAFVRIPCAPDVALAVQMGFNGIFATRYSVSNRFAYCGPDAKLHRRARTEIMTPTGCLSSPTVGHMHRIRNADPCACSSARHDHVCRSSLRTFRWRESYLCTTKRRFSLSTCWQCRCVPSSGPRTPGARFRDVEEAIMAEYHRLDEMMKRRDRAIASPLSAIGGGQDCVRLAPQEFAYAAGGPADDHSTPLRALGKACAPCCVFRLVRRRKRRENAQFHSLHRRLPSAARRHMNRVAARDRMRRIRWLRCAFRLERELGIASDLFFTSNLNELERAKSRVPGEDARGIRRTALRDARLGRRIPIQFSTEIRETVISRSRRPKTARAVRAVIGSR